MMTAEQKAGRYRRLYQQLEELLIKRPNLTACMATVVAVLHHKLNYFFWTGFYLLDGDKLIIGPYQGSLACVELDRDTGVCWAGINKNETIIVPDVHQFPGHIACDSRSNSEIVIPLHDKTGKVIGVLDVDSKEFNSFDEADAQGLGRIIALIEDSK